MAIRIKILEGAINFPQSTLALLSDAAKVRSGKVLKRATAKVKTVISLR